MGQMPLQQGFAGNQRNLAVDEFHPLSFGQRALWFIYQLSPESSSYNMHFAARTTSEVNTAALQSAFAALMARHPALRTTYAIQHGTPMQKVHERMPVPFEQINAADQEEETFRQSLTDELHAPFDLEKGPVFRVKLFNRPGEQVILANFHHIAIDFWSLAVILDELCVLYAAKEFGMDAALPPLTATYIDFIQWQNELLSGPQAKRSWDYWQVQLGGELPKLNFPPVRSKRKDLAATYKFQINPALGRELEILGKKLGITLNTILLSAYQILLSRYTGQHDVIVGTPVAGRSRSDFRGVVGYFVNPIVVRSDLGSDPVCNQYLGQVWNKLLASIEHQDYPFPLLVEKLQPERDSNHSPIIQSLFVYQRAPRLEANELTSFIIGDPNARLAWGGLTLEPLDLPQLEGQFDLTLQVDATSLLAGFQYKTDLFDETTVARMAEHYLNLLKGIAVQPDRKLSELPMLGEQERRQLLAEWNDTAKEYTRDEKMHRIFEEQAERNPGALAVLWGEKRWSYMELNEQANQLAHYLRSKGVSSDTRVAICMERSWEMVVGLLAILKAGGAYVPLDPAYPAERLAYIVENAEATVLLTQSGLTARLQSYGGQRVCVDLETTAIREESVHNLEGAGELAYIIYTSGSTGTPKGVMVRHQPVINLIEWVNKTFEVGESDRVLWTTSYGFDLSVYDLFGLLAAGGSIRIANEDEVRDPERLLDELCNGGITFWDSAPAALQQLVPFLDEQAERTMQSQLRLVFLSGDWIPVKLPDVLKSHFPKVEVVGLGGGTEATVWSNFYRIGVVEPEQNSIPYGKPIQNARYYILDSNLNPCPIGVAGDLYIGGECLAEGYAGSPELTSDRFIADPYGISKGARMYRTGDSARFWEDGNIEFLGRVDNQVKVRGFRVELGEIEAVLTQHPDVEEALIIAKDKPALGDRDRSKELVAYIVPQPEQSIPVEELRRYLKEKLPEYMVPALFVELPRMPVTANGKIDRRALPEPNRSRREGDLAYVAPRTPIEETLVGIWNEVLDLEQIGVYDNFFEFGGHSLLLIQVTSRIAEAFDVELPLKTMFDNPTIELLSVSIENKILAEIREMDEVEVQEQLEGSK
ncbi:amino acid adenylation domain-containing protein [Paenibacillus sp. SI8]|uniref:non-ribosomal peptide synthetase n=1 Tax=unclassified Paenibacillus TaxID=185978 RepID=UPI00346575EB